MLDPPHRKGWRERRETRRFRGKTSGQDASVSADRKAVFRVNVQEESKEPFGGGVESIDRPSSRFPLVYKTSAFTRLATDPVKVDPTGFEPAWCVRRRGPGNAGDRSRRARSRRNEEFACPFRLTPAADAVVSTAVRAIYLRSILNAWFQEPLLIPCRTHAMHISSSARDAVMSPRSMKLFQPRSFPMSRTVFFAASSPPA